MRAVPSQQTRITLVLLGTVAIGVAITLILWQVQLAASRTALSNRFDEAAHSRFAALQTELKTNLRVVQMLSGLRTSGGQLDPREFAGMAAQALASRESIQALAWIPRVTATQRRSFEILQARSHAGFAIREFASDGSLAPAGSRAEYFPVAQVTPLVGNESELGLDLGSDLKRAAALTRARGTGALTLTALIPVMHETGEQFGFLAFQPVYHDHASDGVRPDRIAGFTLGVYRAPDILHQALTPFETTMRIEWSENSDPSLQPVAIEDPSRSHYDAVASAEDLGPATASGGQAWTGISSSRLATATGPSPSPRYPSSATPPRWRRG